jgi:hypothetical protein
MIRTRKRVFFPILNSMSYLGVVTVNVLANALPLNDKTTGELSDQYPNLFVPAGLTFSIWGVIYALLALFIVYQLLCVFGKKDRRSPSIERIGILFFISSLANLCWIFAWHFQFVPLSLVLMLILLASLIGIYLRLGIGRSGASGAEKYIVHLPFSVYLGWVTVATIANVTVLLVGVGWNRLGLSDQLWTVSVIAVGIGIALTVLFRRNDIFYALVVDWALAGILLKRLEAGTVPVRSVIIAAAVGISLITLAVIYMTARRKVYGGKTAG